MKPRATTRWRRRGIASLVLVLGLGLVVASEAMAQRPGGGSSFGGSSSGSSGSQSSGGGGSSHGSGGGSSNAVLRLFLKPVVIFRMT